MTRSPLHRACMALRLPRGLYCLRGDLPLSDAEIRANLRRQHVAAERLVLALAETLTLLQRSKKTSDVWSAANAVVDGRALPASMIGAIALAAMLPEEGSVEPNEWALVVEAAP